MKKHSKTEWIKNSESVSYKRMKKEDYELLNILINSFMMLYNYDEHLIKNSPYEKNSNGNTNDQIGAKHHVGERSIVFRFGYYLQKQLEESEYKDYNVDCEYNRNGDNAKRVPSDPESKHGIYPDLIIHQRGNNDNNLLVIEFKTYWNCNTEEDIKKIKQLIDPNPPERFAYKYKYGIDSIVKIVRFDGWQNTTAGQKDVKKALRSVIWNKYKIHDNDVFNKAYSYIEEYY